MLIELFLALIFGFIALAGLVFLVVLYAVGVDASRQRGKWAE